MAGIKLLTVWTIEDLGPQKGLLNPGTADWSEISAVNDAGVAVGHAAVGSYGSGYRWHAILIDTAIRDIHPADAILSYAHGINKDGWIAGAVVLPPGDYLATCRSPSGLMSVLQRLEPIGRTEAIAIARSGQVVGYSGAHAVSWGPPIPDSTTVPVSLHDQAFSASQAIAVNDSGQVAGNLRRSPSGELVGGLHTGGSWSLVPTPTPGWSRVYGINATGTVVGSVNPPGGMGGSSAFEFDNGAMVLLPDLWPALRTSVAKGVMDDGEIIGNGAYIQQPTIGSWTPITHTKISGLKRLDRFLPANTGWELIDVRAVSPSGWVVVGTGWLNSERRFYRMKRSIQHWPVPTLIDAPHGWPSLVLGQVRLDGGGIVVGPTGPSPEPPWGATPGMGEVVRSLALHELVSQLNDAEVRRAIQPLLLSHAEQWLARMRELSAMASQPAKLKRVRQPSRLVLPKRIRATRAKKR